MLRATNESPGAADCLNRATYDNLRMFRLCRGLPVVFALGLFVVTPAYAEYDCQCQLPDTTPWTCECGHPGGSTTPAYSSGSYKKTIKPWEAIQMYFQCTGNGVDGPGGIVSTSIGHKGSNVTCAKDYCSQPVSVQCTNWGTSSHTIHIEKMECSPDYGCSFAQEDQQLDLLDEYDQLKTILERFADSVRVPRRGGVAGRRVR